MNKNTLKRGLALGAVLALGAAPAAMAVKPADPGSNGLGHTKGHQSGHSHKGGKAVVMYVFKGSYAGDGAVAVDHGNAHAKKADLVGTTVDFDLSDARIVVADNDGNGTKDLSDVATGDRVVVKARLPRTDPGDQPFKAKQLVDQTHAPSSDT